MLKLKLPTLWPKGYSRKLAQRDWRHALIMSEGQASEIFIMNLTSRFGDSKSEWGKSHHNFWKFNSPPCLGSWRFTAHGLVKISVRALRLSQVWLTSLFQALPWKQFFCPDASRSHGNRHLDFQWENTIDPEPKLNAVLGSIIPGGNLLS